MIIGREQFVQANKDGDDHQMLPYVRINLDHEHDLTTFLAHANTQSLPVLFKDSQLMHPSRWNASTFEHVIEQHLTCAQILVSHGYTHLVIGAHDDGFFHNLHSPRFGTLCQEERFQPIQSVIRKLQSIASFISVIVTVEELIPNGMDITDGIALVRLLEAVGIKELIATSGTKDFMPLYKRRTTQKKAEMNPDFNSHEPALASACWLKEHTALAISCLAYFDDFNKALILAKSLGLSGLIEKAQI